MTYPEAITPDEAGQVLHYFAPGEPGAREPGGFTSYLLGAIVHADTENMTRLLSAFPALTALVFITKYHRDGLDMVRRIAREPEPTPWDAITGLLIGAALGGA